MTAMLEDLRPDALVRGILPSVPVTAVSVQWFGSHAVELTYKDPAGRLGNVLLYRDDEPRLELVEQGRPWSFDGDGALFRLVSEAYRPRSTTFRRMTRCRASGPIQKQCGPGVRGLLGGCVALSRPPGILEGDGARTLPEVLTTEEPARLPRLSAYTVRELVGRVRFRLGRRVRSGASAAGTCWSGWEARRVHAFLRR